MALPSLLRARGAAQSASAVGTVRVVNSAQLSFAVTCGSGFYSPNFLTLGMAPPNSLTAFLPPELSSGASFLKQGYSFSMVGHGAAGRAGRPATASRQGRAAPGYALIADPLDPVGNPHFYGPTPTARSTSAHRRSMPRHARVRTAAAGTPVKSETRGQRASAGKQHSI